MITDLKEAQRHEFHVALILAGLHSWLEPYKARIFAGEELPTVKNTFGHLNYSFLGQSSVMLSNDSFALVTSAGGHGSGRGCGCSDGRRGRRDGDCGSGREMIVGVVVVHQGDVIIVA